MTLGVIGLGNMAAAIIKGILGKGALKKEEIIGYDIIASKAEQLKKECGIQIASTAQNDNLLSSQYILIAVKPAHCLALLQSLREHINPSTSILSICAGINIIKMTKALAHKGETCPIIRIMPNTPALIGEGATAFSCNSLVTKESKHTLIDLLSSFGIVEEVEEKDLDAITGLSGSGPAYVFQLISSMADAGVYCGLSRELAIRFAAQTALGSAKMLLQSGEHPAKLRDQVTSPAGTTIEGLRKLEERGFTFSVMEAVISATNKAKEISERQS